MTSVTKVEYSGKVNITTVKEPLIDRICEEVIGTLNSRDRSTGYKGRGIAGRFIGEDDLPQFSATLKDFIALEIADRGYQIVGYSHLTMPETMYRITHDFRNSMSKAYGWMHNGRLDIEALNHIGNIISTTLDKANLPNTN